ncbi:hypothetical protein PghCCS26_47710 [Paenibacillus glycanilyticus]|uniref:Replication protein n=1 Tax=Paenibacillus glycanilyticus TaxID=126569 RepID=A0ABQ6NRC9_9BACL|nr:hypothetical protein [Paenibacillus glycanilyticus]GMK47641.1 hypothetical protein PghCCS26_47710 [Paenibacillus glycanilyticus]
MKARQYTAEHIAFSGTGTAYDPETGEKLIYGPAETHRLVNIAQSEAYHEVEEFKGRQADFTFAAMDAISEIIDVLTTAQCGYLLVLQCYVSYTDGRLVNADKTPMATADMITALKLGKKRQTFYDFLRQCLDNGIITRCDNGHYNVNPRYHFRGVTQNRAVVRSYTAKVKAAYREVNAADLGLMYRMLPYVHYGTNALCANPTEKDPLQIRWFNGKELADAIDIHEKSLSRSLPRMKFGDEYVIARLNVGGTMKYVFNPNVFYRKNTAPDDTLIAMFNVKR